MIDTRSNFHSSFGPGFASTSWVTDGDVVDNVLRLHSDDIAYYRADVFRGEIRMELMLPAPTEGMLRYMGLMSPATGSAMGAYFEVNGENFTARLKSGGETISETITWDDAWTDTFVEYSIRWEAGQVRFFVNDNRVAVLAPGAGLPVVPSHALQIGLLNEDAGGAAQIVCRHVNGVGIHSYRAHADLFSSEILTEASQFLAAPSEPVSLEESITMNVT